MNKSKNIEDEAIMNLIFLGQDQQQISIFNSFAQYESKVLEEGRHKFKSNTIHLRSIKNSLSHTQNLPPCKLDPQEFKTQQSKNKENLKKILQKLQNSPSPTRKTTQKSQRILFSRFKTQKTQPVSNQKSKGSQNKTPKLTKRELDKLFNKKKDHQFIKSLIKAKIVEKLKKTENKKSEKKAIGVNTLLDTMGQPLNKKFQKQRTETLRCEKNKYTNLIREQHFINTSLFSRKNSQINLKKLLF